MPSPNPNWQPGTKVQAPPGNFVDIDFAKLSQVDAYKLLIGGVIPRPIAFVSTISASGVGNLAPFSFFNAVSSDPPCLMLAMSKKSSGELKDTLRNILETKQFVVNSANEWLIEPLVYCAAEYPHGVDEMKLVGLSPVSSNKVRPARVAEAALQFECELYKTVEIGDGGPGSTTIVFGKIVFAHAHEGVYQGGKIVATEYRPVGRLGGFNYAKLGEIFSIPVPEVKRT
ncbi:MAG: flavin reductase family protein [Oligoflexia bacterium]|nr:flavin reductase family protein [Oligoflexia bacterium]